MIPVITNWEASAAALLYDLLNVPAKELGNIMGDYLRQIRLKNLERISHKFKRQQTEKHIADDDLRTIPLNIGIPLLNAASLEDNDVMQELWARLLLNAADANFTSEIRVAFIDIIKTLTPIDAQILKQIYISAALQTSTDKTNIDVRIDRKKAMTDLNIDAITCDASLDNLERCQLLSRPDPMWSEIDEDGNVIKNLTALGILFIRACISYSVGSSSV